MLRRQLRLDPLTGLLNRVGLQESSISRAAVLYLDLDDFKSVNDTFGHVAGDEALRAVARVLGAIAAAGGGAAARLGGDEFVVVVPMAPDELALQRLVRTIRTSVELPVSVGAARCETPVALARALEEADRAMYADKRTRRGLLPRQRGSSI